MNSQTHKCVLIIDESLNAGVIANVAAILSISIGNKVEELVGADVSDKDNIIHAGLTQLPIPVLGASQEQIKSIANNFKEVCSEDDLLIDFNHRAQQSRTYEEYTDSMANTFTAEINYLGIALYGNKRMINTITKGLKLIGA